MSVDAMAATAVPGLSPARAQIAGAIKQAAVKTGASFEYLVAAAKIESNLQPTAAASTSTARGLFQFIEQTWLGTVKEAGAALGYGQYADAITKQSSGIYSVSDPTMRAAILKLRDDPAANAAMAGALTNSNGFKLVSGIGRRPTDNELYIAHFLGVGGASRLIKASEDTPHANAVQMFPRAAAANRPIFYDKSGEARSVAGVYAELTRRYSEAANSKAARSAIAAAGGSPDAGAASVAVTASNYLAAYPQGGAASAASANVAPGSSASFQQVAALNETRPSFRTLFQAGDRAEPISPAIRELWATGASQAPSQAGLSPDIRLKRPTSLDLFTDRDGTFSG